MGVLGYSIRLLIKVNVLNVYLNFHNIFASVPPADKTMGWKKIEVLFFRRQSFDWIVLSSSKELQHTEGEYLC